MLYPKNKSYSDLEAILAKKFADFYYNPKSLQKRVAINFPESRFKITYICRFPPSYNKDEADNQGYIYYKPLWAVIGQLYMFKSPKKVKKTFLDALLFFFISKTGRGKAEIQIAQISLISILPLLIPVSLVMLILILR